VVSGILSWVSNLGPGYWFGAMSKLADDAAHKVMAMICGG
jgi:hypothetical protein